MTLHSPGGHYFEKHDMSRNYLTLMTVHTLRLCGNLSLPFPCSYITSVTICSYFIGVRSLPAGFSQQFNLMPLAPDHVLSNFQGGFFFSFLATVVPLIIRLTVACWRFEIKRKVYQRLSSFTDILRG